MKVDASVADKVRQVEQNGIVLWHDFLASDHFNSLRAECMNLPVSSTPGSYVRNSGPNRDARVRVSDLDLSRVPALVRFLADSHLRALLEAAERRRLGDLGQYAKIEHLTQGAKAEKRDPQTELHSDIYFTSHKAWLYLTDVTMASGPLTYVERTHLLTPDRLYRVYEHSATMKSDDDPSRRVNARESASLPKPTVVVCRANTLVVANTCGYHARLQGAAGEERCSIHIEVRAKRPFRLDGGARTFSKS